jgi:hypothetical protein
MRLSMRHTRFATVVALAGVAALAVPAQAQQAAPATSRIGQTAPDFAGLGATRHGRVADPIRLQDYRGKTIVLAFFFRARTTG